MPIPDSATPDICTDIDPLTALPGDGDVALDLLVKMIMGRFSVMFHRLSLRPKQLLSFFFSTLEPRVKISQFAS